MVDSTSVAREKREALQERVGNMKKASELRRKGKADRVNYNRLSNPDYYLIRNKDWYEEHERDMNLYDKSFWCRIGRASCRERVLRLV